MSRSPFDLQLEAICVALLSRIREADTSAQSLADAAIAAAQETGIALKAELAVSSMELALERIVSDLLADDSGGERTALRLVDVASLLKRSGRVLSQFPPRLLQTVLLTGDAKALCVECREQLVGCFALFRENRIGEEGLGKLALTKAVVLFLRRAVVRIDPVLSGLVRKELMSTLPAWDRSALNFLGKCDVDNVTPYETGGTGGNVDWAVYGHVWGLQRYLSNPSLCETEAGWSEFLRGVEIVQAALAGTSVSSEVEVGGMEERWVRYLTSPELLGLQLADVHLRRNVLVQITVLLHGLKDRWNRKGVAGEKESTRQANAFKDDGKGKGDEVFAEAKRLLLAMDETKEEKNSSKDKDRTGSNVKSKSDPALKLTVFLEEGLRREERWMEWKATKQQGRLVNPGAGEKRKLGMIEGTAKEDMRKDARRLLNDGTIVRDSASLQAFPGLNLFRTDGNYSSVSARPISMRDHNGREASWAEMGAEERRKMLRVDAEATSTATPKAFVNELKLDMEDEVNGEIDEEYWKSKKPAYVWRANRLLGEFDLDRFLRIGDTELKPSKYPVFSIRRAFEDARTESPRKPESSPTSAVKLEGDGKDSAPTNADAAQAPMDVDSTTPAHDGAGKQAGVRPSDEALGGTVVKAAAAVNRIKGEDGSGAKANEARGDTSGDAAKNEANEATPAVTSSAQPAFPVATPSTVAKKSPAAAKESRLARADIVAEAPADGTLPASVKKESPSK